MSNMVINFVINHKDFIAGAIAGYALGHIPQVVAFVFSQLMKIPFVRNAVVKDPEGVKKVIDEVEQELDKQIDAEAAAEKAKQQTPK